MPDGGLLFVPDATIIAHRDLVITLAARYRTSEIGGKAEVPGTCSKRCFLPNADIERRE
jgi:hypothetical protein